ncbi:serine/threonine protein kinase [Kitasatospora sp. MMS16-BH015]|uniref:serine/threonine-protein kinase n=1 Tax=Kitasatospora sp. MMS16-BH015 TaxID=2018025 RepID=UPI000CA1EDCF|nr:serine/threonine-protein kinase [Kitasatospora sp. MMS16-BH015]AUG80495.1 serine/threonine protein kinase [Kitasatospora sp. MMS16-BH015]
MSAGRSPFPLPPVFQELGPDDPREVGGYRLAARLGAGGMGRVYLSHTPGGRPVALKVVRPELAEDPAFRARFAQEVASARLIHGLYTAQVVDAGATEATPWLATAYVPGPSLHEVVRRFGPLPERTVLLLMAGIAEALQVIHAAGVVHRDLKPGNVLIASDGPRVIDFGIARAADSGALTGTGLQIGSPAYMAPEQAVGRPATPATDVHALGALAVHVAGGTPPFGDGDGPATLYRTVHEEPDLSRVPPGLRALLLACLAKDPAHRPTPAEVITAARHHPAVGGHLRFTEDWLPQALATVLTHHTALPEPEPEPGSGSHSASGSHSGSGSGWHSGSGPTVASADWSHAPTQPAHHGWAATTVTTPHRPSPAAATDGPDRGRRRRALGRTALTASVALLVGAAAMVLLLDGPPEVEAAPIPTPTPTPSASASPSAAPTPAYQPVYQGVELAAPDNATEFDLAAGRTAPVDTATWYLGRSDSEFLAPDGADTHLARDADLTLLACLDGLARHETTTRLPFGSAGANTSFCLRSADGRSLALVRVLATPEQEGAARVSVDQYRRDG